MTSPEPDTQQDHIVIIDDDAAIARLLTRYFGREGFLVSAVADGEALWQFLENNDIDVALVDLNLPGEDGLSITRRLKQETDAGIIILTGKNDEIDRVVGLEIGADDYVSKPFSNRELLARLRAVLRRVHELRALRGARDIAAPAAEKTDRPQKQLTASVIFDQRARHLKHDRDIITLTELESQLLAYLTDRPEEPVSRATLSQDVTGRSWDPEDRSIDVHIANLRKKLDGVSPDHKMIATLRGVGYMFQPTSS